ncbi:MAG: flagellar biosynthesis protein FlhB [Proteobacteria bacterium]|nr:flagellar biosynthesis protein FlhB [Pseudomonadota bacterium]
MAEEQDQEDKTEEPTLRRLEKAREEGQALRSADATTAAVTLGVMTSIYVFGSWFGGKLTTLFKGALVFDSSFQGQAGVLVARFAQVISEAFLYLIPLFLVAIILVVGTASGIGGLVFSLKAAAPKASKINPLKGFARIFGLKALVELVKALLKFALVATVAGIFLYFTMDDFFYFGWVDTAGAIGGSLELVFLGAAITCLALLIIAAIDIPYQRFEFIKNLKMSKKDVKDELKDMEGQPEVRQQIRRKQRELAEQRMLEDVPKADVVITNPQHFAVALVYDMNSQSAPRVLAKGQDFMALRIKEKARESGVEIFEAPPLARALYFSVDIGFCIPEALFQAVAQVIAYVYGLKGRGTGSAQSQRPKLRIPKEMEFDAMGKNHRFLK